MPENHHELDQEAWWKSFDRTIKNRVHLHHLAAGIEEAYYKGVEEAVPNALEYFDNQTDAIYPEETVKTSIALAPFYALEATIDYYLSKGENLSEKNVVDAATEDPLSLYLLHAANLTGLLFTLPFHEMSYPLVRFVGTPEKLSIGYRKRLKVMGLLLELNCRTTLHR